MAKHTALPWKGDLNVDSDQFGIYPDTGKMEFPIAIMPDFVKAEVSAANAHLIVRAVNAHDELVEALREARAALHQHYVDWDGEPEDAVSLQLARAKCDAALSKALGNDGGEG